MIRQLKLPMNIYKQYKKEVRDNEDIALDQAEKKFYRNMCLGIKTIRPDGRGYYVQYGKLHFIVSENDVIVWMKNNCPTHPKWKRDNRRYLELNKELGIEDDITMIGLIARTTIVGLRVKYGAIRWKLKNKKENSEKQITLEGE